MSIKTFIITTNSLEQTHKLGHKIGVLIEPGSIIALSGDLGSGKTSLVQGIAKGLNIPKEYYVTSPTYNIINQYPGNYTLFHIDLYRIMDIEELDEIGFYEIIDSNGIVAIEWPEIILNEIDVNIEIKLFITDNDARRIHITLNKKNNLKLYEKLEQLL